MPELRAAFFLLAVLLSAVNVFAEQPGQGAKPAPAVPAAAPRLNVTLKDDLLSVDLLEAEFGTVMKAVGARAGIKVEMTGPIQQKKLTTKFSGIELERGILRLMTLMKEKNYTLRYDTAGRVNALEVYGADISVASPPAKTGARPEPPKGAQKTPQPATASSASPVAGVQKNPPQQRRLILPAKQSPPVPVPAEQPAARPKKQDSAHEDEPGNDVEELPYIEPQKKMPAATKLQ